MLSTKVARALGLAATGQMLRFIGYQEGAAVQTPELGPRLALLFGPVVGTCFIAAAVVFLFMPLTKERHGRIQALLLRRRAQRERQAALRP
jgi:GPH family glycoside/pentoside/hexuronide:cation symporter